jgi:ubiquinone/menaquinone biosynthesis C-methylase UbiE
VKDWVEWHRGYDDPSSSLSARLECVKRRLTQAIDQAPPGPIRLVSLCAGQGHDVIGVLPGHRRRDDVTAVLVESNAHNAELARLRARAAGLSQVEIRQADAGQIGNFVDALPADVLLLCGIFGNVSDRDIEHTVGAASAICTTGATVIWTRHRRPPDLTPAIRAWFTANGFDEVAFDALDTGRMISVGTHRLVRAPASAMPAGQLFRFQAKDD